MLHPKGGTVYIGRDNTLDWQLTENDAPLPADKALAITRARLESDAVTLDSGDDPGLVAGLGTDTLSWRLGHVPELAGLVGQTIPVRLVVFAPEHPQGLVWADNIQVAVR
ncbi:MAG: hypothetical protein GVY13_15520 [Alphaproteobacteria bacterium]|jgi:hypothetical protein|nr:hypothetical protein [Alphaproteobacteria bacterium]